MPTQVRTGVGRIVWGHPGKSKQMTDDRTKPPTPLFKADGTPRVQWAFGVAFPKAEFQSIIWPAMAAEAGTGFPSGVPNGFAWKYKDGDTDVDQNGKPYRDREGYAGCYVLNISTEAFAPPIYKFNPQTGGYDQLAADQIKTGDFVVLALSLQVNVSTDRAKTSSLYINPQAIEHVAFGKEIVGANAIDPKAAFGGVQHQLPPGASLQPVAPSGAGMPGTGPAPMQPPASMPGMPGAPMAPQPPMQPGMPAPVTSGYPQPGMPGAPMAPQPGMPGAPMAPQPGMPGMPAPAPDFVRPGMPGAPMTPPAPPAPPAGPQRPVDPAHIHGAGTPGEMWWINGAWTPAGR